MKWASELRFRGLQNYTTLKQADITDKKYNGFRGLQNYTTLKQLSTQSP